MFAGAGTFSTGLRSREVHVALVVDGRVAVVDADPDLPLSDEARLAREPARDALDRLMLLSQGGDGTVELDRARDDLARWGATRQSGELAVASGCLAVPIFDAGGLAAGAVAFSGPRHRVDGPGDVLSALRPAADALAPLMV